MGEGLTAKKKKLTLLLLGGILATCTVSFWMAKREGYCSRNFLRPAFGLRDTCMTSAIKGGIAHDIIPHIILKTTKDDLQTLVAASGWVGVSKIYTFCGRYV